MSNLRPINPSNATGKTKELLDFVQRRSSRIPNMVRLMALPAKILYRSYFNLIARPETDFSVLATSAA